MKKVFILGLVLAILAILAVPMAAFASTTEVTGTMNGPTYDFKAPTGFGFGTFNPGDTNRANSDWTGLITVTPGSNGVINWTVTAQDITGNGHMWLNNVWGGTELTNEMLIALGEENLSGNTGDCWASAGATLSNVSSSPDRIALYARQIIAPADKTAGTYYIFITVSASCQP